jgi:anti-sigma B factor antagonist
MNDYSVLTWEEDITLLNIHSFRDSLAQFVGLPQGLLILNLEHVQYLNSAAIGIIIQTYSEAKEQGKQFVIAGFSTNVDVIFKIVKMDMLMPVFKTMEEIEEIRE